MKIGILGAGLIANKMGYTLSKMEDVTCCAVGARDKKRAEEFAKKHGFQKAYGSYEELVQDDEVELIYIATPHSYHFEHAKLCLNHGKPVLCEKAFMANAEQAEEIFRLSEEKHVFITEAIWTRYMPSRKIIDDIIAKGEIGEVTSVTANLGYDIQDVPRLTDPMLAGGALLDVGIYPLTFASMILGNDIEEIQSCCVKGETGVDVQNSIILKYKNGTLATLHSGMLAATEQYGIVYGTKGYLIAENINNVNKVKIYTPEPKVEKNGDVPEQIKRIVKEIDMPEQITGFEDQVRASMEAIHNGAIECTQIPHAESLQMMKVMDELRHQWNIVYPFEC
ncbi:MAG: Gfo/Idh/MocA family oxidoreductase [Lachnospiraceae bacterium]